MRVTVRVRMKDDGGGYEFTIGSVEAFQKQLDEAQWTLGRDFFNEYVPVWFKRQGDVLMETVGLLLPMAMTVGVILLLSRFLRSRMPGGGVGGGGPGMIGRSKAKLFDKETGVKTTFNDVAGLLEAKQEIQEFVSFLKRPEKYKALGARIPKGALLVGPPGTGKTLLAKATAGEAGVPFYSISGSDFTEMFVGVGASRVRDLFKEAREHAPSIIWIDEIDAVGRARSSTGGGNDERENTLNQLLVEMDGFDSNTTSPVVVMAGTNRADVLDKALLRPGRFDRQVTVDLPDIAGRRDIFLVHLKPLRLPMSWDPENISKQLATLTPGFSGADIANACNEAALTAARRAHDSVEFEDFETAIERIIGGIEKRSKVLSPEEKRKVAYHEAGHAVAGWFLEHTQPLLRVSIVPRGLAALGYAQYLPRDQYLYTTEELFDRMCMTLGGRIAEELVFGEVSTGAQDDLKKITKSAYAQISQYGMNKVVGNLSFPQNEEGDGNFQRPYSNKMSDIIDREARALVKQAYDATEELLRGHMDQLKAVGELLIEKEVINAEDLVQVLGPRPKGLNLSNYEAMADALLKEADERVVKDEEAQGMFGGEKAEKD